jgi:hypothetical protein
MSKYFDNKSAFLEPLVSEYGTSIVMTNVSKPKKTRYLNIDTRFTDDYQNTKDYNSQDKHTITLPERINDVSSIKVSQIEIPLSFYNVSTCLGNNHLVVKGSSSGNTIVNVVDGYYTGDYSSLLFNNLTTDLQYTIDVNNYIRFTNLSTVATYTIDFAVDVSGNSDKYSLKSKLGWLLGFRNDKYTLGPSTSVVSESCIDCCPVRYIYLVLDEYSNSFPNSFSSFYSRSVMNKKILAKISLNNFNNPYKTLLTGNESNGVLVSDTRTYSGKVDVQRISVELVNEFGKTLNMNGLDYSFLLKIEHE